MTTNRKIKRNKQKKQKKEAQKKIKKQMFLFGKLPNKCLTCDEKFDKKSKEHALSWKVIVREKEEKVHLYCPECWGAAEDLLKGIENDS